MPQYTNTFTAADGTVTNSVLDTTTNTQIITVTAPTGQVATATVNPSDVNSNFDNIVTNIERQLNEQGAGGASGVGLRGITNGINNTTANVTQQQQTAASISTATGDPVPAAPSPTAPVPAADNPNPVPAPVTPPIENDAPATTADTYVNGSDLASDQVAAQQDPSSEEYINESDRASDSASQQIAAQQDPSSEEYINESDRASDAASQTIQAQKDPSSEEYINESDRASDAASQQIAASASSARGLTVKKLNTNSQGTQGDVNNDQQRKDWRVLLSLAPGSDYLYTARPAGILNPLVATKGVLFPYTPQVSITYAANYDPTDLTHSNYKIFQYRGSSVDQISITCDFTAQDTFEANYLLAVIHFFRSVTKMFYGKDQKPNLGSPPPLCYLNGLGAFQFNNHPLAITSFNYSLPNDVDYIRATNTTTAGGVSKYAEHTPDNTNNVSCTRLGNLNPGATAAPADFRQTPAGSIEPTYVPTKMAIQISAVPVVARNDISNKFSLKDYANGNLLRNGGIW